MAPVLGPATTEGVDEVKKHRVTLFICSGLLFHGPPLAPLHWAALLQCLFTPRFRPIHTCSSDGSIGQSLSAVHLLPDQ